MQRRATGPQPIVILGITQRSGTHVLYDALLLHPAVAPASGRQPTTAATWEDHLLSEADQLVEYVARVQGRWNWGDATSAAVSRKLMSALGRGMVAFISELSEANGSDPGKRPLTKTPSLVNLDLIDILLPDASVAVIIRDPRGVVASAVASFGGRPEQWARVWRRNARILVDYTGRRPGRVFVVRYEDFCVDPVTTVESLLEALSLDPKTYDFEAVKTLPVRGSSLPGGYGWAPRRPPPGFDPVGRGRQLDRRTCARVEWLAGTEMHRLGYGDVGSPGASTRTRQRLLDAWWAAGHASRRLAGAARAGVGEFRRDHTRSIRSPWTDRRGAPLSQRRDETIASA